MSIHTNYSLKNLNTFGIDAKANFFVNIKTEDDLKNLLALDEYKKEKKLILGSGSNILFTKDFDGLIIKLENKVISLEKEDNEFVYIKADAGVIWHDFVDFCLINNYGGVENLSLIPGTVGASPVQNIGAYGVELKDVFDSLSAINIETQEKKIFYKDDCNFNYRSSIFKNKLKNQYIITSVTFKLSKNPQINTSYGDINKFLQETGKKEFTIKDVSQAVCSIRASKLPDPKLIGNAGSFFKNPEIDFSLFEKIKQTFPLIPFYKVLDPQKVKIPAGWLIEQCGWKGKTFDNYGVHKNQALVLVNYGNAVGNDIYLLSEEIKKSIFDKFNINLETEVNII